MIFGGLIARIGASVLFGRAKKIVSAVPSKVWIGLAVVIVLLLAAWWHESHSQAMLKEAYEQGKKDRDAQWEQSIEDARLEAQNWKTKYESASSKLTETERQLHEEQLRSDSARADALRLRGPGAAAAQCRPVRDSVISGGSGGSQPANEQAGAAGTGMSSEDGAIVPWSWLVTTAQSCDADRSEVQRWRSWYPAQRDLFEAAKKQLEESIRK